jgi:hypothetical protein
MKTRKLGPTLNLSLRRDLSDFSLVAGGPLFQLLCRTHLSDDALMLVHQRVIIFLLVVWLPLLVLSGLAGNVLDGNLAVPFLRDIEAHTRFLVAMPLLIVAELVVHQRMAGLVQQFFERHLIPKSAETRFEAAITSAFRLRNSLFAEVLLIALVYCFGILIIFRHYLVLGAATWYATPSTNGWTLSLAGMWYSYVSLPVFQFLLLRWYFRLFIWTRFLWQVSRIELNLIPQHPDRVGGLGFLSLISHALTPLAVAHGALVAGNLANQIFFAGGKLPEFINEIAGMVGIVMCIVLGPLLIFTPQLAAAKRRGLREFGALAERYVREFDAKWLRGSARADEPFLGSADIQSLADLANGYEVVRTMRLAPITRDTIVQLAVAALVPIAPLLLTMTPLEEILKSLFGVFF